MSMMIGRQVTMVIKRNTQEAPALTIFQHELPILSAMHGKTYELKKCFVPESEGGIKPKLVKLDAETEMQRLGLKYGAHPSADMSTAEFAFNRDIDRLIKAGHGGKKFDEDWTDRIGVEKDKTEAANLANEEAAIKAEQAKLEKNSTGKKKHSKKVDINDNGYQTIDELKNYLDDLLIEHHEDWAHDQLLSTLTMGVIGILDNQKITYDPSATLEEMAALIPEDVTSETESVGD